MENPLTLVPVEVPADIDATYQREYIRCGLMACRKCSGTARGHGPYWFAYWEQDGQHHRAYVGRTKPRGKGRG